MRRTLDRCQPCVCSTSLLPSTPSITNYYYAGLSDSSVCVALCWSGSGHICLAECSVSFSGSTSSIIYFICSVPQGSVLGPLLFIVYTTDLADIAEKHGVSLHAFADETQVYLHCRRTDMTSAAAQLVERCIADVSHSMSANRLKLNTDKTELLWVGSRHSLSRQGCRLPVLQLGPDSIAARNNVRLLGVTLSSDLSLDRHISKSVHLASTGYASFSALGAHWT